MLKKRNKTGFFEPPPSSHLRCCDHTGCKEAGEFRAPKSRENLLDYYWFCLDHVRLYNLSWDYFHGLSPDEVERMRRDDTVWERPSWPFGQSKPAPGMQAGLNRKWAEFAAAFGLGDEDESAFSSFRPKTRFDHHVIAALRTLDLAPPLDFDAIKQRYKILVKQFHPDLNGGEKDAEERFKSINEAFQTLKRAFGSLQKQDHA